MKKVSAEKKAKSVCEKYGIAVMNLVMGEDIGEPAGMLWNLLGKEGKIPVTHLPFKAGLTFDIAYGAMGWLAKEKKIHRIVEEKNIYVDLTKTERHTYQAQNGR